MSSKSFFLFAVVLLGFGLEAFAQNHSHYTSTMSLGDLLKNKAELETISTLPSHKKPVTDCADFVVLTLKKFFGCAGEAKCSNIGTSNIQEDFIPSLGSNAAPVSFDSSRESSLTNGTPPPDKVFLTTYKHHVVFWVYERYGNGTRWTQVDASKGGDSGGKHYDPRSVTIRHFKVPPHWYGPITGAWALSSLPRSYTFSGNVITSNEDTSDQEIGAGKPRPIPAADELGPPATGYDDHSETGGATIPVSGGG